MGERLNRLFLSRTSGWIIASWNMFFCAWTFGQWVLEPANFLWLACSAITFAGALATLRSLDGRLAYEPITPDDVDWTDDPWLKVAYAKCINERRDVSWIAWKGDDGKIHRRWGTPQENGFEEQHGFIDCQDEGEEWKSQN